MIKTKNNEIDFTNKADSVVPQQPPQQPQQVVQQLQPLRTSSKRNADDTKVTPNKSKKMKGSCVVYRNGKEEEGGMVEKDGEEGEEVVVVEEELADFSNNLNMALNEISVIWEKRRKAEEEKLKIKSEIENHNLSQIDFINENVFKKDVKNHIVVRECYTKIYEEMIRTIYICRKMCIKKGYDDLREKINEIKKIKSDKIVDETVQMVVSNSENIKVKEFKEKLQSIKQIEDEKLEDVIKEIIGVVNEINPEYDNFYPQLCFLIYGNKQIGKTTLWYYLAYKFITEKAFDNYNVILLTLQYKRKSYIVRYAENGNNINLLLTMPKKGNNPTIIICDNVEILEDEYSEDDIIILISSPDTKIYKIFRNKREPIQFYIPPLKGNELKKVLEFHKLGFLLKEAISFGGNIRHAINSVAYRKLKVDEEFKPTELSVYLPEKYDEDFFIYNTDSYNKIPTTIKYQSNLLKYLMPLYRYDYNNLRLLYNEFLKYRVENYFERICHVLLEKKKIEFENIERIYNKKHIKVVDIYSGYKIDYIFNNEVDIRSNKWYVDFTEINDKFSGIDGCFIESDAIYGVQMTVSENYPTKGNVTVFNKQKENIIKVLSNKYKSKLEGNGKTTETRSDIARFLYNYGYIPEKTRISLFTDMDTEEIEKLKFYIKWRKNIPNVMKDIDEKIIKYFLDKELSNKFINAYKKKKNKNEENKSENKIVVRLETIVKNIDLKGESKEGITLDTLKAANNKIMEELRKSNSDACNKLLHDLNDYLVDCKLNADCYHYSDKNLYYENAINGELQSQTDISKYINSAMKYTNPIFTIIFCLYNHTKVNGGIGASSYNFDSYKSFIEGMKNTMNEIYDWDNKNLKWYDKDQIIYRRSRRLRFYTHTVTDEFLKNILSDSKEEEKQKDNFVFDVNKIVDEDDIERIIEEDNEEEFPFPYQINKIDDTENDNRIETHEDMVKYLANHSLSEGSSDNINNSLSGIFGDHFPKMDEDNNTIRIYHNIFQYPKNVVYIRESYKEMWDYLKDVILFNQKRKENPDDSIIEEFKRMKERHLPKACLLRGNPGLGKTSFIIYLLCKLQELRKKVKYSFKITVIKNTIVYKFTEDGRLNVENSGFDDIVISDSYDIGSDIYSHFLVLYISSPDRRSYNGFFKYAENEREFLYMDVFSKDEINDWIDKCLPHDLGEYIKENEVAERYGFVPRHVYFDSIYSVYFKKSYWKNIYCNGVNIVIGQLGFIYFMKKYIIPCKNGSSEEKISYKMFDVTLCHYIIKYNYINIFTIGEYEMEFISDEVKDYMFRSIKHTSKKSDVKVIRYIFYEMFITKPDRPVYKFLFQELVWCKCIYNTDHLLNPNCKENDIHLNIFRIENRDLKMFNKVFDCPIYKASSEGYYILHLCTIGNGEMVYVVNNCFIHVCNDRITRRNDYGIILFSKKDKYKIKRVMNELRDKLKWNKFIYISVHPQTKQKEKEEEEEERLQINSNSFSYLHPNDFREIGKEDIIIQYFKNTLQDKTYDEVFKLVYCKDIVADKRPRDLFEDLENKSDEKDKTIYHIKDDGIEYYGGFIESNISGLISSVLSILSHIDRFRTKLFEKSKHNVIPIIKELKRITFNSYDSFYFGGLPISLECFKELLIAEKDISFENPSKFICYLMDLLKKYNLFSLSDLFSFFIFDSSLPPNYVKERTCIYYNEMNELEFIFFPAVLIVGCEITKSVYEIKEEQLTLKDVNSVRQKYKLKGFIAFSENNSKYFSFIFKEKKIYIYNGDFVYDIINNNLTGDSNEDKRINIELMFYERIESTLEEEKDNNNNNNNENDNDNDNNSNKNNSNGIITNRIGFANANCTCYISCILSLLSHIELFRNKLSNFSPHIDNKINTIIEQTEIVIKLRYIVKKCYEAFRDRFKGEENPIDMNEFCDSLDSSSRMLRKNQIEDIKGRLSLFNKESRMYENLEKSKKILEESDPEFLRNSYGDADEFLFFIIKDILNIDEDLINICHPPVDEWKENSAFQFLLCKDIKEKIIKSRGRVKHYISYIIDNNNNEWYEYNDENVTCIGENVICIGDRITSIGSRVVDADKEYICFDNKTSTYYKAILYSLFYEK